MRPAIVVLSIAVLLGIASNASAYSVLAHEAIIDSAWDAKIRPLLLQRFPGASPDDLRRAHAFAYGGAIIQDLGYYPHGSRYFTDLTHYVRSGDFIEALLRDSQDLNDYAFALGALSHYAADNDGHRIAVNRSVPLLYRNLRKKYGDVITYEDNPAAHLKTEFGFDVLEVAKGRYAPDSYHNFIGFEVAKPLLERAFQDTYSIPLRSAFSDFDRAVGSYRYAVRSAIPEATKIAWVLKQNDIKQGLPGITRKRFLYNLSRASYQKEWGNDYRRPGPGARILAFVISLLPKVGPLKALALRTPTPQAENMFMASFNAAFNDYQALLDEQREGHLDLPNRNFDTGSVTPLGVYFMADEAYARLLDDLAKDNFRSTSTELRSQILAYYKDSSAQTVTKRNAKQWARTTRELDGLESMPASRPLTSDSGLAPPDASSPVSAY